MKLRILILIGFLSIAFACSNNDDTLPSIKGQYSGTFERNGIISNVSLAFTNGTYIGESEIVKFPAICNGTYSISSSSIVFRNQCIWTADFDWTLILGEQWDYTYSNGVLTMEKANGDKYNLQQLIIN